MRARAPLANGSAPISIVLSALARQVPAGAELAIVITARNLSSAAIRIIGVVDGAEAGARFPKWVPHVVGPKGRLSGPETPDFTSPLRPADFRLLEAGQSFDPTDPVDGASYFPITTFAHVTEEPGDYALSLELSTEAPSAAAWLGTLPDRRPQAQSDAEHVTRLLTDVPRLHLRSNTLNVKVI